MPAQVTPRLAPGYRRAPISRVHVFSLRDTLAKRGLRDVCTVHGHGYKFARP
jgi:DNA-binding response OmpR family regulator